MARTWRHRDSDDGISPTGRVYVDLFTQCLAPEVDAHEQEQRRLMLWDISTGMRDHEDRRRKRSPNPEISNFGDLIRLVLDEKIDGRGSGP